MNTPFHILSSLQQIAPVDPTDRVIVAISGGVDSVVLAFLCKQAGLSVELAHCNFQLRGPESDRDEELVKQVAVAWQLPVSVNRVVLTDYAGQHKLSVQEAARKFRYEWFASLAVGATKPTWILTAHQADDNAETVAMHFFRGAGLSGLTGIPPRNGNVLRPLLGLWRHQILKLAHENGLPYAEDSSNTNEKYTRNYFRHTVFPALEKVYPHVKENLNDSIRRFTEIEALYTQCISRFKSNLLLKKGDEYKVSIRALRKIKGHTLLYELFTPFGFSSGQLAEIEKLLNAKTGAVLQAAAGSYRLLRNRNFLWLSPAQTVSFAGKVIDAAAKEISFEKGNLSFSALSYTGQAIPVSSDVAWLDARYVVFPLLLRPWRPGDYFYPLGLRKKKKIARFLIDQKRSLTEKENIWVLESNKKIVWIVGMRIDDRAKITHKTQQIFAIRFTEGV